MRLFLRLMSWLKYDLTGLTGKALELSYISWNMGGYEGTPQFICDTIIQIRRKVARVTAQR